MSDPDLDYVQVSLNESLSNVKITKDFKCGDKILDKFVTSGKLKRAVEAEDIHATAVCGEDMELIGFMTLGYSFLDSKLVYSLDENPPKQLSVAKLVMLAVDQRYQGLGIGTDLILEAFVKTEQVHSNIPLKGLYLDAAPGKATFYSDNFGFEALAPEGTGHKGSTPMYMPIDDVIASLKEADELG